MAYTTRHVEKVIKRRLAATGAVVLEGARGTGKSATAKQLAGSFISLDSDPALLETARTTPQTLLAGPTPRVIDEWQLAPELWNVIRHEVDERQQKGQFIISGSASPLYDVPRHSGIGRFSPVRIRPMTIAEFCGLPAQISFAGLLADGAAPIAGKNPLSYADVARQAVIGGLPANLGVDEASAAEYNADYLDLLAQADYLPEDMPRASTMRRIRRLLTVLSRRIAQDEVVSALAKELGGEESGTKPSTVRGDLDRLTRLFAYEPQPAWSPALRSGVRIRVKPKMHLVEPALALAAMNTASDRLARQPEFFGQVFESMVVRDLRVYAGMHRGEVYHYRDDAGLEVDAILDFGARWAAVEIKLGTREIPKAQKNLQRLRERVDTAVVGEPEFMAIITATEDAYTLSDGTHVIPLPCLGE